MIKKRCKFSTRFLLRSNVLASLEIKDTFTYPCLQCNFTLRFHDLLENATLCKIRVWFVFKDQDKLTTCKKRNPKTHRKTHVQNNLQVAATSDQSRWQISSRRSVDPISHFRQSCFPDKFDESFFAIWHDKLGCSTLGNPSCAGLDQGILKGEVSLYH